MIKFEPVIEITPLLTTFLSVLIVVVGWWYNQWKNRKNEIAKEARNYRIEMLHNFMKLSRLIDEKNMIIPPEPPNEYGEQNYVFPEKSLWTVLLSQFKMHGCKEEKERYEDIISKINKSVFCSDDCITDREFFEIYDKIKELEEICINRIRKELKLEK